MKVTHLNLSFSNILPKVLWTMDCKIENRFWLRIDYMNENDAEVEKIKGINAFARPFRGKINSTSWQSEYGE